jgi:SNF2 family DNA or RNA helicase
MLIHPETRNVVLAAKDPAVIQREIKPSRGISHPEYNVAVKHTEATTRTLRRLGYAVPAPISLRYSWPGKYKPFDHQRVMAEYMTLHPRVFNLSEMGVGKTASTLWAADYLMEIGAIRKVLVLSPLSTMDRVWANDIFDVLMHRSCVNVYGTRDQRLRALGQDVDFYIMNHEGVTIDPVETALRQHKEIDLVIVDEAGMFRNSQTKKYKALRRIVGQHRLWMLTGTPCPNSPTDAWALARLVNPRGVPQYFGQFQRQTMVQASQYRWEPRPDAYVTAFKALQPAVRYKKQDCLDLPPVTFSDRSADLTKKQEKAVETMRKTMQAEAQLTSITAANAADKINKLRQILCGVVKDTETEEYITLPHKPRVDVLKECIEEANAKVIVVVPFKGIIESLNDELTDHSVALLNGDVPARRRNEIIRRFKDESDPQILLCHPKVMAHGLNLTEADTLIFFAPIYSNDEFQQVVERFNRTGQTRKMTVVRLAAHSLEWKIYNMVDKKRNTQDNILELYHSIASNEV